MEIFKIEYTLIVKLPLRLGSGLRVGNLLCFNRELIEEDKDKVTILVPGNTLRGLILSSIIKLACSKLKEGEKPSKLCTVSGTCSRPCKILKFLNLKHGHGVIFHFGKVTLKNYHIITLPHVTLEKTSRTIVKQKSPYMVEVLDSPTKEAKLKAEITLLEDDKELLNLTLKGIKASIGMCIGGKRTWGYGRILQVENISWKKLDLDELTEKEEPSNLLKAITPIPLVIRRNETLNQYITRLCRQLLKTYFNINKSTLTVKATSHFKIIPIGRWNEALRKPEPLTGLKDIMLKVSSNLNEAKMIKTLAKNIGITPNNHWTNKCGYGIIK